MYEPSNFQVLIAAMLLWLAPTCILAQEGEGVERYNDRFRYRYLAGQQRVGFAGAGMLAGANSPDQFYQLQLDYGYFPWRNWELSTGFQRIYAQGTQFGNVPTGSTWRMGLSARRYLNVFKSILSIYPQAGYLVGNFQYSPSTGPLGHVPNLTQHITIGGGGVAFRVMDRIELMTDFYRIFPLGCEGCTRRPEGHLGIRYYLTPSAPSDKEIFTYWDKHLPSDSVNQKGSWMVGAGTWAYFGKDPADGTRSQLMTLEGKAGIFFRRNWSVGLASRVWYRQTEEAAPLWPVGAFWQVSPFTRYYLQVKEYPFFFVGEVAYNFGNFFVPVGLDAPITEKLLTHELAFVGGFELRPHSKNWGYAFLVRRTHALNCTECYGNRGSGFESIIPATLRLRLEVNRYF